MRVRCGRIKSGALPSAAADAPVLNVYSARHYQTDEALYAGFTEQTGIRVNRIEGKEDELLERLKNEGAASPADVLVTVDAARLAKADALGLFAPVESKTLAARIIDRFGFRSVMTVNARVGEQVCHRSPDEGRIGDDGNLRRDHELDDRRNRLLRETLFQHRAEVEGLEVQVCEATSRGCHEIRQDGVETRELLVHGRQCGHVALFARDFQRHVRAPNR